MSHDSLIRFEWTKLELKPDPVHGTPLSRSSHGISYLPDANQLFLYGGENVARVPLQEKGGDNASIVYAWLADLDKKEWKALLATNVDSIPPFRIAHAQAVCDNVVYIFGGRDSVGMEEHAMNDLWAWDASTQGWTEILCSGTLPEPRSFHRMLCVKNTLFVFGGCGKSRLADLYCLDLSTKQWKDLPPSGLLKGRGGPNVLLLESGKKLAVIAGFCGHETSDGHVYNIDSGAWEEALMSGLEKLRPRSVCVAASFPEAGVALIFGGEVDPSQRGHEGAGGFANDLVVLDEVTGAELETMGPSSTWPGPRGWADGAASATALYLFGGLTGDDKQPIRLNDLWQLDVSKKV